MRPWTGLDRRWWGLVFVLPVVAFFATFSVFPVLFGFWISLTDYNLLDEPLWVGLDNYRNLLDDRLFLTAFRNTLVFVSARRCRSGSCRCWRRSCSTRPSAAASS